MRYQNIELHNVVEMASAQPGPGHYLYRVPIALLPDLNEMAQMRANALAGVEIRFQITSGEVSITLQMDENPAVVEIYAGPFVLSWHVIGTTPTTITCAPPERHALLATLAAQEGTPFAPDCYRVLLPRLPAIRLLDITGEVAPPTGDQVPNRRWLAYGSSITHGNMSIRPTDSYVKRTAQMLGVDVVNLGFGGGAHCEAALAQYIANRHDWDFATLEMGINMVGGFTTRQFDERVHTFVKTIVQAHPDKWIFCLDMFPFYGDFGDEQAKAADFRQIVRQTVADLASPKLVHIEAEPLLPSVTGLAADVLHPAPAGMEAIARGLTQHLREFID